jgi:hypothetical protein
VFFYLNKKRVGKKEKKNQNKMSEIESFDNYLQQRRNVSIADHKKYASLYYFDQMVKLINRINTLKTKGWGGGILQKMYFEKIEQWLLEIKNLRLVSDEGSFLKLWLTKPFDDYQQTQFLTLMISKHETDGAKLLQNQTLFSITKRKLVYSNSNRDEKETKEISRRKRKEPESIIIDESDLPLPDIEHDLESNSNVRDESDLPLPDIEHDLESNSNTRYKMTAERVVLLHDIKAILETKNENHRAKILKKFENMISSDKLTSMTTNELKYMVKRMSNFLLNIQQDENINKNKNNNNNNDESSSQNDFTGRILIMSDINDIKSKIKRVNPHDVVYKKYVGQDLNLLSTEELKTQLLELKSQRVIYASDFERNNLLRAKLRDSETKEFKWCGVSNLNSDTYQYVHNLMKDDISKNISFYKNRHFLIVYKDYTLTEPVGFAVVKELFHDWDLKNAQVINYKLLYYLHLKNLNQLSSKDKDELKDWTKLDQTQLPDGTFELEYICSLKPNYRVVEHTMKYIQTGQSPFENLKTLIGTAELVNRGNLAKLYSKNNFSIYFGTSILDASQNLTTVKKLKARNNLLNQIKELFFNPQRNQNQELKSKYDEYLIESNGNEQSALQKVRVWLQTSASIFNMYQLDPLLSQDAPFIESWVSKFPVLQNNRQQQESELTTNFKQDVYLIWKKA